MTIICYFVLVCWYNNCYTVAVGYADIQTEVKHWQKILSTAKLKVGFPTDSSNDIINFLVYSDFLNFCQQPVRIMTTFAKTDIADVDNVNIEAILPLVTPA